MSRPFLALETEQTREWLAFERERVLEAPEMEMPHILSDLLRQSYELGVVLPESLRAAYELGVRHGRETAEQRAKASEEWEAQSK